jgi:PIN domain nuclease of toxin-antitoxin system
MRILLDTNIFLWAILDDAKLTKDTRAVITHAAAVYVSSASIWEIAIKKSLGKIEISDDLSSLEEIIPASGFLELPITSQHAASVSVLKQIHKDPFDRLLIAQAQCEPLIFLTADRLLEAYSPLVKAI